LYHDVINLHGTIMAGNILKKAEFTALSEFCYQLRNFVRFSEDITGRQALGSKS